MDSLSFVADSNYSLCLKSKTNAQHCHPLSKEEEEKKPMEFMGKDQDPKAKDNRNPGHHKGSTIKKYVGPNDDALKFLHLSSCMR